MRNALKAAAILFVAWAMLLPAWADEGPDYQSLMQRIETVLRQAESEYQQGQADLAKTTVQKAYFELFENLEGPIRINISAARSNELEAEFGDIRKLIMNGEAVATVSSRIDQQIAAIWKTLPALEDGVVIRAEVSDAVKAAEASAQGKPEEVSDPFWVDVNDTILSILQQASDTYQSGDEQAAEELIRKAHWEGYKNSLLETVVRRYVSQSQDIAFNAEFTRIMELVKDGKPARMVRASAAVLHDDIADVLPGLPVVNGSKMVEDPAAAPEQIEGDWASVADQVIAAVNKAASLYEAGDQATATATIQNSYFDIFEDSGMETIVGARDAGLKTTLEGHFSKLTALIKAGASKSELTAEIEAMRTDLDTAVGLFSTDSDSPWALFIYSLIIILREGFEAMLVVTAIATYLIKTGNRDKLGVIVNSVAVALGLSVVTAILFKLVFHVTADKQELLEGATMLLAALVLFFMSYWLLSKAEAERWMQYIKGTVDRSIESGSMKALWFASFLAVYREGAETVLFYQALALDASDAVGIPAIIAGFVLGCLLLGVLYFAFRFGAQRLAIKPFFVFTGALLYYMAFVFTGKGIMELVEGKIIEPTLVSWLPEFSLMGIYPYWQTALPQAVLLVAAIIGLWVVMTRKPPKDLTA
ncbi:FTR1 family iron permease [Cohaesibacter marisflavi]|uniref:FTR1 family iron permease n=1 Tax=Cohaesibacter marisflavi TaxID=655353 RepID=UPI0029C62835|nr:FTR1 family protein [Cohaesibacter marisflavi]